MDMKDTQTTSTGVKPPSEFWKQTKSGRWYYDEEAAADKHLMETLSKLDELAADAAMSKRQHFAQKKEALPRMAVLLSPLY